MNNKGLFQPGSFGRWIYVGVKADGPDWDSFIFFLWSCKRSLSTGLEWNELKAVSLLQKTSGMCMNVNQTDKKKPQQPIIELHTPDDWWVVSDSLVFSVIIRNKCDHVTPAFTVLTSENICVTMKEVYLHVPAVLLVKMLKWHLRSVTLYSQTVKRGAVTLTNHLFLV